MAFKSYTHIDNMPMLFILTGRQKLMMIIIKYRHPNENSDAIKYIIPQRMRKYI